MTLRTYTRNTTRWVVKNTSFDALKEMLDFLDTGEHYEIIRKGHLKKVVKYTFHKRYFYLKQYGVKQGFDAFKSLFLISKAQREWDHAHLLLENHILTAEPVAVGENRRFKMLKDCFIVFEAVSNSASVHELLANTYSLYAHTAFPGRKKLLADLVSFIRTIHDRGIFHGELHAENILANRDDTALLYLIDLGGLKLRKGAPLSWRIRELARLLYSVRYICTNEEIAGLLDKYTDFIASSDEKEGFHKAVFNKIAKIKHRFWHSRSRKCLKENEVFTTSTHEHYTVSMRKEWDIRMLGDLINTHTLAIKEKSNNVIKVSSKIGITCLPVAHGNIQSICIKEYRYPSFLKKFLYSFNNSPARRSWLAAHCLLALNLRTPKPIALFERKRFGVLQKSFIIMEDISVWMPCNRYVIERFNDLRDRSVVEKKRGFIICLANSFRQIHDLYIYHSDLKANNLIVIELQDTWGFSYLDLDRVYFNRRVTVKKRIKNLSQLNASLPGCISYTDRLRFYQAYTGVKDLKSKDKQIVKAIIQMSIERRHVWNPGGRSNVIQ